MAPTPDNEESLVKLVLLMKKSIDFHRDNGPLLADFHKLEATRKKNRYDAYVAAGFTAQEALALTMQDG